MVALKANTGASLGGKGEGEGAVLLGGDDQGHDVLQRVAYT